jgi:hypothetical protein
LEQLSTSEKEMTYKVLLAQWNHPVKQDCTDQVREDLFEFRIGFPQEKV